MRIDSSGNVLVGQYTANSNTVGTSLRSDGRNFYCADGNYSGHFNRKSSDGAIVHFAKDDTIVGSIGTGSGLLTIGTNNTVLWKGSFENGGLVAPWVNFIVRCKQWGCRQAQVQDASKTYTYQAVST